MDHPIKRSIAGKMQMIEDLISPRPVFDEFGDVIEYLPPVLSLTKEEILELLNFPLFKE